MHWELGLVILVLLVLLFYYYRKEKLEVLPEENYVRLYDTFDLTGEPAYEVKGPVDIKYAVKIPVKSIDVNIAKDSDGYVELWNVRENNTLASSMSDFYENTIYTTPAYLRGVSPNLTLITRVYPGQRYTVSNPGKITRILVVAKLK